MADYKALIQALSDRHNRAEAVTSAMAIIEAGIDPNWIDPDRDTSLLEVAVEKSCWEAAIRLIELGARVRDCDTDSFSTLEWAGLYGPRQVVEALLRTGASWEKLIRREEGHGFPAECNAPYMDDRSYLRTSCGIIVELIENRDFERLGWLWELGVSRLLDVFDESLGWTPLMHTAEHRDHEGAAWLIDRGAWANPVSAFDLSFTPLDRAVMNRDIEMARLLLSAGANPNIPTWMHVTAVERAIQQCEDESDDASEQIDQQIRSLLEEACKRFEAPKWPNGTSPAEWPPKERIAWDDKAD
ncbi:MAG: ankyrin repeat domain-containing protein [Phycisphaerales bacterium]|nr:hypothetical protein [Planctomycetota bacterium]MCH8508293.1 ankyrin repeat domain-containing protein [Phycisphaerales bacterium]